TAALSRAEPVVTETMAELYLRQGHPDEALRVYEALLAKRPGDRRLRARVAGLSSGDPGARGGDTGESVQTFLRRILAGRPPARGQAATPPAEGNAAPSGPVRGSGSKMRPPMEDEGDLDQFQAWLRGLKS